MKMKFLWFFRKNRNNVKSQLRQYNREAMKKRRIMESVSAGKLKTVKGIQFLVNDRGEKTSVMIDLKEHAELWEDFYDTLTARSRIDEPRESLESVRKRLKQQGKLNA